MECLRDTHAYQQKQQSTPKIPGDLERQEQKIDLDDIRFDTKDTGPITQINFDLRYSLQD